MIRLRPDGVLDLGEGNAETGKALLGLVKTSSPDLTAAELWVRRILSDHIRKLVSVSEDGRMPPEAVCARCRPDAMERLGLLASVPPMTGGEYWCDEVLVSLYGQVDVALAEEVEAAGGDLFAHIQTFGPSWRDLGKLSLHLAENKGDKSGSRPFAFLATFVNRTDADGKVRHLPLSAALKAYASRPAALGRILAPLEAAAKGDRFLSALLESRRIFQPCALTVGEAYGFLKGIAGYEAAGLLVRTGRLWAKAPPKAKVSVTVGKTPGGGLNGSALCDFSAEVTVNGEALSEEELRMLAESRDGLVRIRGEWVMADPEKIQELLAHWQEAKRLVGEGVTMAQALRLLAGGGLDSLVADSDASGDVEVRANGELKELLASLTQPKADVGTDWPNGLGGILRPYQKTGVDYLRRTLAAGLGACLADDMGLGKTLQVLTLVDLWKRHGDLEKNPVLIVMPTSLLANWRAEASKFTPQGRRDPPERRVVAGLFRVEDADQIFAPGLRVALRSGADDLRTVHAPEGPCAAAVPCGDCGRGAGNQESRLGPEQGRAVGRLASPTRLDGHADRESPDRPLEHFRFCESGASRRSCGVPQGDGQGHGLFCRAPPDSSVHPAPAQDRQVDHLGSPGQNGARCVNGALA